MALRDRLGGGRRPAAFDPAMLVRSVIALPLLERIDEELQITLAFEKAHPEIRERYNAAVIYRETKREADMRSDWEQLTKRLDEARARIPSPVDLIVESPTWVDLPPPHQGRWVSLARMSGEVFRLLPLLDAEREDRVIEQLWPSRHDVIIDINLSFKARPELVAPVLGVELRDARLLDSRKEAQKLIRKYIDEAKEAAARDQEAWGWYAKLRGDEDQLVDDLKTELSSQYVFARLAGLVIRKLVEIDGRHAREFAEREAELRAKEAASRGAGAPPPETAESLVNCFRTIHHIWPDFEIGPCITRSIRTVKADAAQRSFTALGEGITWAVMDSGIQADHPHFRLHGNIDPLSTYHADFTAAPGTPGEPLKDEYGHGTHVAGIIAGEQRPDSPDQERSAVFRELDSNGQSAYRTATLSAICGMAPKCRLVSLKVLNKFGDGKVSNLIAAIGHIQQINGHGRELHIQGVNISLAYPFDPKWFGCGHSPLCVEVNRLVRSGVVVVVAAGNTGYGTLQLTNGKESDACLDLTINDPGNAECAITVGSTHRDMPHVYGVSFFSSKGPTGDGRIKPDLLAPGEKIISCASPGSKLVKDEAQGSSCSYFETSGTSMAAPHVSGAIAAFLSIRGEFIGEAERVKQIFTSTATDLGRERYFQGCGLVDLMRAIQSV